MTDSAVTDPGLPLADIIIAPTTLTNLHTYGNLHRGLTAVSFFGLLSFICSVTLFFHLAWKLLTWRRTSRARTNQFIILIFNLIFADIQQSIAFLLNIEWLSKDTIEVGTTTCWAQGWFVSTGDLSSGLFTLAIAIHSFMDIVCDYRLGHRAFLTAICSLWAINFLLAIIGPVVNGDDFYARAGAWCWMNGKYKSQRLWLHYIWVIIAEFGTVITYALIFMVLQRRVNHSYYHTSNTAVRARSAAKLIIAYPIVYVVCTLPLVKARLTSIANEYVSFTELTIAAAFITSNGWLDVLLYCITRRSLIFGHDLSDEKMRGLDTFRIRPDQEFGTTTVIESTAQHHERSRSRSTQFRSSRRQKSGRSSPRHGSTEELVLPVALGDVKAETTVVVQTDIMELGPVSTSDAELDKCADSFDARSRRDFK